GDAAAADGAAPIAVNAKNSADVARFPGETLVANDDAKLGQATPARTAPKTGSVVATLKPGEDVTKVAEYQGSILVTFPDAKDAKTTLMGWINKDAFNVRAIHDAGKGDAVATDGGVKPDAGPPKCPAHQVAVILAKDPVCKKKCTKDADCKGGAAGACANANGINGNVVRVCAAD